MTDLDHALSYCRSLHERLETAIGDVEHVRARVAELEALAPGFPETRFCKSLILPVIDEWTNEFLQERFSGSPESVFAALRCEGYRDLSRYYEKSGRQTYYSGTPHTKLSQCVGKTGHSPGGQACPDWAIRFTGPQGSFRLVGEAKFAYGVHSRESLIGDLYNDLAYYLKIDSDLGTDWGHDFGYGVGYATGSEGTPKGELVDDYWPTQRILMSVFS